MNQLMNERQGIIRFDNIEDPSNSNIPFVLF